MKQESSLKSGNSPAFTAEKRPLGARLSMREKLIVFIVLFFGAMIAMLWLFQTLLLDDFYRAEKKKDVLAACKALMIAGVEDVGTEEAKRIAEKYGVCIAAYEMGDVGSSLTLLDTHILSRCTVHNTNAASKFTIYRSAKEKDGEFLQYFTYDSEAGIFSSISEKEAARDSEVSMVYARIYEDTSPGYDTLIILDSIISPMNATIRTVRVQLGVFTALFTFFAIVFAGMLSTGFTRPIEKLTRSAKSFGTDSAAFNADGYREIKELSETLDYASSELAKTEMLRRELIANISHDLRTPLTMLIGYGEMMRDIPEENTPENAGNIVREAERLNALVTDMLELSRIRSGTAPLKSTVFSLTQRLKDTRDSYSELLSGEGYEITLCADSDATVCSDSTMIGQVIQNLVLNAVQHTGKDKKVEIAQIISDGWVTVTVSDTGMGLPPEELPQIWERYYKINSAHRRGSGSGLGLSIVKAIMEQTGGHYGVDSAVEKGSTFWFALPISSQSAAQVPHTPGDLPISSQSAAQVPHTPGDLP
ncbi:MAG: HAMP domain-containing histidine kinase [Clostridia bacterium]|nr:HAMP domain-containing histidine kinase [Clostridia bacterium]